MSETKSDDAAVKTAPPASIESLYAAQESALLLYAQTLVNHDGEAAQDIVQEAFLRLHAGFDTVRQPQAWLYRTVHNLALTRIFHTAVAQRADRALEAEKLRLE